MKKKNKGAVSSAFDPVHTSVTEITFGPLPPRIRHIRRLRTLRRYCGCLGAFLLLVAPFFAINIASCRAAGEQNVIVGRYINEGASDSMPPSERKLPLCEVENSVPRSFRAAKVLPIAGWETLERSRQIVKGTERPLRVLQIGDSHVRGNAFPKAIGETLRKYLGREETDDSTNQGGLDFSYIGSNGATAARFMTDSYMLRFKEKEPDLIIISLGTNEAHGMGYKEEGHTQLMEDFLAMLQERCPDADFLLTTPPGDYLSTRYVDYRRTSRSSRKRKVVRYAKRPNPMTARCAKNILAFAADNNLAAYDLYEAAGGEEAAVRNWVAAHYMRPDRIHFTPQGYELQGKMVGEALVKGLIADSTSTSE